MSKASVSVSGGPGICGLLLVAFVVLKLCGVIGWSWWWVLAPLWIPLASLFLFFVGMEILAGVAKEEEYRR